MTHSVDEDTLRQVLASYPAGVVVVTATGSDSRPRGFTASAFCSVSLRPPMVLVCVDSESQTLPAILHSRAFTVNILAAGREQLARAFAAKGDDKFVDIAWRPSAEARHGPILHEDVAAFLVCVVHTAIEAGDHWVCIGEVVDTELGPEEHLLLYHRRSFITVGGGGGEPAR